MFTGIVEEMGKLDGRLGSRFRFGADQVMDGLVLGASIAVNGCCLTVVNFGANWWEADVVNETVSRT
ncbi:MAG: riboflavin synthase, partial [Pseudonocardiaceae bacterium]